MRGLGWLEPRSWPKPLRGVAVQGLDAIVRWAHRDVRRSAKSGQVIRLRGRQRGCVHRACWSADHDLADGVMRTAGLRW